MLWHSKLSSDISSQQPMPACGLSPGCCFYEGSSWWLKSLGPYQSYGRRKWCYQFGPAQTLQSFGEYTSRWSLSPCHSACQINKWKSINLFKETRMPKRIGKTLYLQEELALVSYLILVQEHHAPASFQQHQWDPHGLWTAHRKCYTPG